METRQQILDRCGGRLMLYTGTDLHDTFTDIQERGKHFLENFLQLRSRGDGRASVSMDFIRRMEIGAQATLAQEAPFIIINCGTVIRLKRFFDEALAHPGVLPRVGDPSKETKGITDIFLNGPLDLEEEIARDGNWRRPKDPYRAGYSRYLLRIACEYIIIHEFAHVAHGHLDWLEQLNREGRVASKLDRQTLEFDADNVAALNTFVRSIYVFPRHRMNEPIQLLTKPEDGIYEEAISATTLSLYVLWRNHFESLESKRPIANLFTASHPNANTRFLIIYCLILQVITSEEKSGENFFNNLSSKRAWELINAGIGSGDHMSIVLGGQVSGLDLINKDAISADIISAISKNWAFINPQLEPLLRAGTLAPIGAANL